MPLLQRKRYLNLNHAGVYAPAPSGLGLQTSLTGFWSMENTSWLDDTASATTLTATGSPTSSSTAPAMVGNYLALPGSAYLSAVNNTNINTGGGSFSVQAWVYTPAAPGNDDAYVSKGASGFLNGEWGLGTIFTSANVFTFGVTNAGSSSRQNANDSVGITNNTWTHLVGTYNNTSKDAILYKNGSQVGTVTMSNTLNTTTNDFSIGRNGVAGSGLASGNRIDQVGFWKGRVLSSGDATLLYNSGAGLTYAAMA